MSSRICRRQTLITMQTLEDGRYWANFGRIGGRENVFRIALCDRYGYPLMYYRGYFSARRGAYVCYPEKVGVPGSYDYGKIKLGLHDVRRRY